MLQVVVELGIVWSVGLVALLAFAAGTEGPNLARALWVDTLGLVLTALLALLAYGRQSAHYMDGALALALLAFAGTVAAAVYLRERDPES